MQWVLVRNKCGGQIQEMVPQAAHGLVAGGAWEYVAAEKEAAVLTPETEKAVTTVNGVEAAINVPLVERAVRWFMGPRTHAC